MLGTVSVLVRRMGADSSFKRPVLFLCLKSELCAVDTNGKKIFSDISDVLRAEICSPGRLLYTPKYGKNTNFCVYREIFKKISFQTPTNTPVRLG